MSVIVPADVSVPITARPLEGTLNVAYKVTYGILQGSLADFEYRQTSNIRHTVVGNKIDEHSDVVGASPVGIVDLIPGFNGLCKDNF